jgi:hypothetical protein
MRGASAGAPRVPPAGCRGRTRTVRSAGQTLSRRREPPVKGPSNEGRPRAPYPGWRDAARRRSATRWTGSPAQATGALDPAGWGRNPRHDPGQAAGLSLARGRWRARPERAAPDTVCPAARPRGSRSPPPLRRLDPSQPGRDPYRPRGLSGGSGLRRLGDGGRALSRALRRRLLSLRGARVRALGGAGAAGPGGGVAAGFGRDGAPSFPGGRPSGGSGVVAAAAPARSPQQPDCPLAGRGAGADRPAGPGARGGAHPR